jgi:hypothetical protein
MNVYTRIGIIVAILFVLTLAACDGAIPRTDAPSTPEEEPTEIAELLPPTEETAVPEGGEEPTDTAEPPEPPEPTEAAAAPTSTEVVEEPTPTAPPTTSGGEGCLHIYFPVANGASWTYASKNEVVGPYSFTDTITEVRSDGFTVTGEFEGLVKTMEWACDPEGLIALQFGGGAAASVTTSGGSLQLETTEVTGVTLPWEITPGMTWSQSFVISGDATLAPDMIGTAEGNIEQEWEAIGMESVTVPAGTFDALKVNQSTSFNYVVTVSDITLPIVFDVTGSVWFAPGVGWIKSTGTGEMMGEGFSDTLELTGYSVP